MNTKELYLDAQSNEDKKKTVKMLRGLKLSIRKEKRSATDVHEYHFKQKNFICLIKITKTTCFNDKSQHIRLTVHHKHNKTK